jgi:hypothetical protein
MIRRTVRDTLTAVEMDCGDVLELQLLTGEVARIELRLDHGLCAPHDAQAT